MCSPRANINSRLPAPRLLPRKAALAAINANYFDENGRPLAYLKSTEKEINRSVSKHALYTGIFGMSDATPFVVHRDDFQPAQSTEALQTGPLLLNRGAPVEVLSGLGRYARRSVIGMDKESRVIVAVADAVIGGLSFGELQELFRNGKWQVNAVDLLNLDGGGSAQLYVKAGKFENGCQAPRRCRSPSAFFPRRTESLTRDSKI